MQLETCSPVNNHLVTTIRTVFDEVHDLRVLFLSNLQKSKALSPVCVSTIHKNFLQILSIFTIKFLQKF